MSRVPLRVASIAVALGATVAAQQPAPAFRFERPIVTAGSGPRRLAIDVPLLVGSAPFHTVIRTRDPQTGAVTLGVADGLRDLRLYDSKGTEVGYILAGEPPLEPVYKQAAILPIAPIETRTERTSGFEADLGELLTVDRFRIEGVEPPFLKRLKLEGSGDREHWTLLVADGTLFNLPEEKLLQTELRFAAGPYRYLRLTWDDTHSARIARLPAAVAGQLPSTATTAPLLAPLVFERRPSEPGRSRFRIRLPGANLPIAALDLAVGGDYLLRSAKVFQSQLSGSQLIPMPLGQTTLRRVVRDGIAASALRLPIEPPADSQIDLVVDDDDNPPLDLRGVAAVFAELPWIYLDAPGGALTARYGNATLTAPRYDLEAIRSQVRVQTAADARWGDPRPGAPDDNAGVAPALPTIGASLDATLFRYTRAVPAGNAGLVALGLDAGVLAHSTGAARGFSDLRVIDASDRQIPYIVEQASEPLSLPIAIDRITTLPAALGPAKTGRTVYHVSYPMGGLPETRLVLTTRARVFERDVRLVEIREPDPQRRREPWVDTIAAARWIHADQNRPATPLTILVRPLHGTEVFVTIDEGDNAPLPLDPGHLLLPAYRLRFFRDGGARLRLAYGRSDLDRPKYDLALLAPQVLGTTAADVAPGAELPAADVVTTAGVMSARLFWAALALATVVLLGLIARLLKKPRTI
ncbi:MAG TPA: DUF3999 family protein [Vicinamibacterales bacterium]|nr:DUF3999 family protein [Vicinamibacterales bacterium]